MKGKKELSRKLKPKNEETYEEYINRIRDSNRVIKIPPKARNDICIEKHHIIPRSLGGSDNPENLIELYPEEHFWAHELLFKENPDCIQLVRAYWFMSHKKEIPEKAIDACLYGKLKRKFSKIMKARTGENNPNYGNHESKGGHSVIRVCDGKEWDSMKECCIELGLTQAKLRKICQSKGEIMYWEDYSRFQENLFQYLHTKPGEAFTYDVHRGTV